MNININIDFDPRTKARTTDPQTSKDAAEGFRFGSNHATRIWDALFNEGNPEPMTAKEIATVSGLRLDQVYRRRNELVKHGLVVVTEEVRDGCNVWECNP